MNIKNFIISIKSQYKIIISMKTSILAKYKQNVMLLGRSFHLIVANVVPSFNNVFTTAFLTLFSSIWVCRMASNGIPSNPISSNQNELCNTVDQQAMASEARKARMAIMKFKRKSRVMTNRNDESHNCHINHIQDLKKHKFQLARTRRRQILKRGRRTENVSLLRKNNNIMTKDN